METNNLKEYIITNNIELNVNMKNEFDFELFIPKIKYIYNIKYKGEEYESKTIYLLNDLECLELIKSYVRNKKIEDLI